MNEQDIKVAIDQLTAMSDFALDLRDKLSAMSASEVPAPVVTPAPAVLATPIDVVAETDAPEDDSAAIEAIAVEYGLADLKVGELREYLTDYDIEFDPKAKKPTLIDLVATAIYDGTIPTEDDDSADATTQAETAPADVQDDTPSDSTPDEVATAGDEYEASQERLDAEEDVEEKIRASYPKKLKPSAVKKFLATYYDGDPEMADLDDKDEDELLDLYVDIQRALVDDDGNVHDLENDPYYRNDEIHCCGVPTQEMEESDNLYCTICGTEYAD